MHAGFAVQPPQQQQQQSHGAEQQAWQQQQQQGAVQMEGSPASWDGHAGGSLGQQQAAHQQQLLLPMDAGQQQPQRQQQPEAAGAAAAQPETDVEHRKLVVLGLPWDTDTETLHQYFAQFGPLHESVVMRDRYTGKSRGFGFVTYVYQADAQRVVAMVHQVDGRRCEAKFALPRGGTHPARTTRIFVARIPASVQDVHFRAYFERWGAVQDAYMPKDALKQAHRGIGFVTYAAAEAVEQVMSTAHSLHGQELAVDRATPKDRPWLPSSHSSNRLSAHLAAAFSPQHSSGSHQQISPAALAVYAAAYDSVNQAAGVDASRGSHSPTGSAGGTYASSSNTAAIAAAAAAAAASAAGTLHPDALLQQALGAGGQVDPALLLSLQGLAGLDGAGGGKLFQALQQGLPAGGALQQPGPGHLLELQQQVAYQQAAALAHHHQQQQQLGESMHQRSEPESPSGWPAAGQQQQQAPTWGVWGGWRGRESLPGSASEGSSGLQGGGGLRSHMGRVELGPGLGTISEHSTSASMTGPLGSTAGSIASGPADAMAGPRIFVGKLNKDTTEADVRDYFTRFGYVMDVYMPRDRLNRSEHRGFGFVTFETEGAIQRVAAHGMHQIRGSVVAIDSAAPRRDPEPLHSPQQQQPLDADMASLMQQPPTDMDRFALHNDELGPARHPVDRLRQGYYRPY